MTKSEKSITVLENTNSMDRSIPVAGRVDRTPFLLVSAGLGHDWSYKDTGRENDYRRENDRSC